MEQATIDGITYWFAPPSSPGLPLPRATFLLSNYDEYLIAYRDRNLAVPRLDRAPLPSPEDGESGRLSWGATLAYVGERNDTDFDRFPAPTVRLDDYLLASASLDWRLSARLELYARAENAFDARYQDVYGYLTPGRTVHAGVRVRLGD